MLTVTVSSEDTVVHWRVRPEERVASATGEFVTQGGGSAKHLAEVPLGVRVAPGVVDLHFHWIVGEVPFDYSVRQEEDLTDFGQFSSARNETGAVSADRRGDRHS